MSQSLHVQQKLCAQWQILTKCLDLMKSEFSCVDAQSDDDGSWVPIVEQPRFKEALVTDVCLATTAAPTFLPPVDFTVRPTEEKKAHTKKGPETEAVDKFNMIDGGMAVNNPVGFSSGGQPGLFSLTFYEYESFLRTYLSIDYHNLGCPAWSWALYRSRLFSLMLI